MSYAYVFTVNNYTEEDVSAYKNAIGTRGVSYIIFGKEVGDKNGTPHLQGYLQCNHNKTARLNEYFPCKKHVMATHGYENNHAYCSKQEDFFEAGTPNKEHTGHTKGKRTDLEKVKESIENGLTYEQITDKHFEQSAQFNRFIKEQITQRNTKRARDSLRSEFDDLSLYSWQRDLLAVVDAEPHHRQIHWIWSEDGNLGKSTFATYLGVNWDACVLEPGKKADLAYIFAQDPKRLVIFDIPRTLDPSTNGDKMDYLYNLAEQLKNCRLTTTKYDSRTIYFPRPHVLFFANFEPDMTKWSTDRYVITRL